MRIWARIFGTGPGPGLPLLLAAQSMIETVAKLVEQVENIKRSSVTFLYFQKEQLCNFKRR